MKHSSVKLDTPIEFINVKPLNPLISKCQIKVCYVGDKPNRNGSVITKEVATEMANSLPGSPIVGFYNEANEDFEEHNRIIDVSNGKFEIKDTTKPYGFVDLNAKVWFQKFMDDGREEHEYLMTEGYLWTGQYPECMRVITDGNNQSMELDENHLTASWSDDENGGPSFFIINEAIISKLCILGEDCEPCFEGSQITSAQFSLDDEFKQQLFSMMKELKEYLQDEGGAKQMEEEKIETLEAEAELAEDVESAVSEEVVDPVEPETEDNSGEDEAAETEDKSEEEPAEGEASEEEEKEEETEKEESADDEEESVENGEESSDANFALTELEAKFSELQEKYDALLAEKENLEATLAPLSEFKLNAERKEKEAMIASFYMLSDEDKADVIANVDTYSLEDIEAKLSIICVRNKVSFDLDKEVKSDDVTTFNLNDAESDSAPAWVKAAMNVAKNMK